MKFIETRNLTGTKLRSLCNKNNWYTRGTNEDYSKLFDRLYDEDGCYKNLTTELIAEIAEDIWQHSEITGYTITTVMCEIAKVSTTYFDMEV